MCMVSQSSVNCKSSLSQLEVKPQSNEARFDLRFTHACLSLTLAIRKENIFSMRNRLIGRVNAKIITCVKPKVSQSNIDLICS